MLIQLGNFYTLSTCLYVPTFIKSQCVAFHYSSVGRNREIAFYIIIKTINFLYFNISRILFSFFQNFCLEHREEGYAKLSDLSKSDMSRLRCLAVIEVSMLFDHYNIPDTSRKGKKPSRGKFFITSSNKLLLYSHYIFILSRSFNSFRKVSAPSFYYFVCLFFFSGKVWKISFLIHNNLYLG